MPYCEDCEKYWTPSSVNADGTCRRCGAQLDAPDPDEAVGDDDVAAAAIGAPSVDAGADTDDAEVDGADDADEKVPWHFKLMIVALVVYLGWRFVQLGIAIFT